MMNFVEKIKKLGGDKLLLKFGESFDLSEDIVFVVKTDRGCEVLLSPERIRKIIVTGIPYFNPKYGWVREKECADALLNWRIKRLQGPTAMEPVERKHGMAKNKNKSR